MPIRSNLAQGIVGTVALFARAPTRSRRTPMSGLAQSAAAAAAKAQPAPGGPPARGGLSSAEAWGAAHPVEAAEDLAIMRAAAAELTDAELAGEEIERVVAVGGRALERDRSLVARVALSVLLGEGAVGRRVRVECHLVPASNLQVSSTN